MAGQLTEKQLAMINTLMYAREPNIAESPPGTYQTLGEFINDIDTANCARDSITCSQEEWDQFVATVSQDEQLCNMRIVESNYEPETGSAHTLLQDPETNQAYVVFRGTGYNEWVDDAVAGSYTDNPADDTISVQQQKAIDYINSLGDQYGPIIVSGHSKGGNKAKITAIMCDNVSECYSFDGQGFSDEFIAKHRDEIARAQDKIHNHNVSSDFVNILLNDVGDVTWYEGQRTESNPFKNHDPMSFFTDDGEMITTPNQSSFMAEVDKFFNSFLRSEGENKRATLQSFGELLDVFLGTGRDHKVRSLIQFLANPANRDFLGRLINYLGRYASSAFVNGLTDFLRSLGMGLLADLIEKGYREIAGNGELPDGSDIRVDSQGDQAGVDADPDMAGSVIFVAFEELNAVCEELRQAVELYNEATARVKTAAEKLASNWEGEAREAFVISQQQSCKWYEMISGVALRAGVSVREVLGMYRDAEQRIGNIVRGG